MKILVTGGTGYIGSHTVVVLQQEGYEVVIVDNLSNSSARVIERIEMITGKKPDMRLAVVDGQGGGIGKAIVEKRRQSFGEPLYILALGTNAVAASLMLKAGANECASGENAIILPKVAIR